MALDFQAVGLIVAFFWLIILTILFWRSQAGFAKLFKQGDEVSIAATIKAILKEQQVDRKNIDVLLSRVETLEAASATHIQKIGLIRFNPFKDTGGDQSFIFALTDESDSGIVISGLYSRSGTRWYAKRVMRGQGTEHELSEEEKKAVSIAK